MKFKRTLLQDEVVAVIECLEIGVEVTPRKMYKFVIDNYPLVCAARGYAKHEPLFKNDCRRGIQRAYSQGLLRRIKRGQYFRLGQPVEDENLMICTCSHYLDGHEPNAHANQEAGQCSHQWFDGSECDCLQFVFDLDNPYNYC